MNGKVFLSVLFVALICFQLGSSVKLLTKHTNCLYALLFFEEAKLAKLIIEVHETNKSDETRVRAMVVEQVHTLAYDYGKNEVLFVDDSNLGTIWSTNGLRNSTQVLHENNTSFDNIAVDWVTENIYFLDRSRGIGVCSRRNKPASCMFLIPKPAADQNVYYNQLLLYPQQGVLLWTRGPENQPTEVMIASMNGQEIRSFMKFRGDQKRSNASLPDSLYVDITNSQTHLLSVQDTPAEGHIRLKIEHRFELYCNEHHMEQFYRRHKNGTLESERRKNRYAEGYSLMTSLLMVESKLEQRPNICKQIKCSGICVLLETDKDPMVECISIDDKYLKPTRVADFQMKPERSTLNTYLIIFNVVTLLVLVCVVILITCCKIRSLRKKAKSRPMTYEQKVPISEVELTSI